MLVSAENLDPAETFTCMVILEDVVCGAVELYCNAQRGLSVILPTLIDINGVDKIIEP